MSSDSLWESGSCVPLEFDNQLLFHFEKQVLVCFSIFILICYITLSAGICGIWGFIWSASLLWSEGSCGGFPQLQYVWILFNVVHSIFPWFSKLQWCSQHLSLIAMLHWIYFAWITQTLKIISIRKFIRMPSGSDNIHQYLISFISISSLTDLLVCIFSVHFSRFCLANLSLLSSLIVKNFNWIIFR